VVQNSWVIKTPDLKPHEFHTAEQALSFLFSNTTKDDMCTIVAPAGAEYTVLRRPDKGA
jgi:hypothetical protein